MMKKFLLSILITAAIVILAAGGSWLKAWLLPPEAVIPATAEITPSESVSPGEEIFYRAEIVLPLTASVKDAVFEGKNTLSSPVEIKFKSYRFDRIVWQIGGNFRIMSEGKAENLKISFSTLTFPGNRKTNHQIGIPELLCQMPSGLTAGKELFLAPEMSDAAPEDTAKRPFYRRWSFLLAVIIAIIAIAGVILFLFIRRRKQLFSALPLDEKTLREIRRLCQQVRDREIRSEKGFALLCDIIRNYLEVRFQLPVTRQTTMEFIRNSELAAVLPPGERIFLAEFLNTADRIKFAGENAGENMLENAAADAVNLVRATTVREEENKQ